MIKYQSESRNAWKYPYLFLAFFGFYRNFYSFPCRFMCIITLINFNLYKYIKTTSRNNCNIPTYFDFVIYGFYNVIGFGVAAFF